VHVLITSIVPFGLAAEDSQVAAVVPVLVLVAV
jgi:hypothetical protein